MAGIHRSRDRGPDEGRRRFLAILAGVFGLGTIGTLIRNQVSSNPVAAPSTPASTATSTGSAAPTTASTPTSSSSIADPSTTSSGPTITTQPETNTTDIAPTTTTSEPATTTSTEPATTATPPPEAGVGLVVLEKAAWGAKQPGSGFVSHSVSRITVHHTALVLANNAHTPAHIRQHQTYHQSLGWPDLAYHFMIDRAGNLYEGRPFEYRGDTGTSYDPSGHFLPCLEGDYNSETPTVVQLEALAQLCAWAASRWGVDPSEIGGHRDYASTSCPGAELYQEISGGALAARVDEILLSGAPSLSYLRGDEAVAVVAAVESGG